MKILHLILIAGSLGLVSSCASKSAGTAESATQTAEADASFIDSQPLESGLYDADYYDITGTNARRGHFDGRVYLSLSPEISAFYVFENGNRTKIDYLVSLKAPFERGDSGVYRTTDVKGLPVTLSTDSTTYMLSFEKNGSDVTIGINPKPRHTGTPLEILEKINEMKKK